MQWIKPDVKLQPNMLAVHAAINGEKMFEYDKTRDYIFDNQRECLVAYVIGNYITPLPVGFGELGLDIGSFNLWMKRMFPQCKYERLRDYKTLSDLENAPRCVVWIKNIAVYVENNNYYAFRNLDNTKIFAIWWL